MLDPIIAFFTRIFELIGKGIGWLVAVLAWPFIAFWAWVNGKGWFVKIPVFVLLLFLLVGYGYFFVITQFWSPSDRSFVEEHSIEARPAAAGAQLEDGTCQPSAMVSVTAQLIDNNVNQGTWVPSNPASKAGLFFIRDWNDTPFFDNRAAYQLGINQATRRTAVELVDRLGRVRGTSRINSNLQSAREAANYRENAWLFSFSWPFIQPTTQARLRDARESLLAFNEELVACEADFDARADNLLQFLDRVVADIGSTSQILQSEMEGANFIGFDARADDRFWFTYGQLYAYDAIMTAARSDFRNVQEQRNLDELWTRIDEQFEDALDVQPWMVANGSPSSLVKSHLESIGFDLLRVRSNMVEMRDVLDR